MGNVIEMVDLYERRIHRLEQELELLRKELLECHRARDTEVNVLIREREELRKQLNELSIKRVKFTPIARPSYDEQD